MVRIVLVLVLGLSLAAPAIAEKRVALVIGIDKYDNLGPQAQLRKARSDSAAVAQTFRDLGFDVIAKNDVTRSAFNSHWQDFLIKLAPGDTAAFYFAGHGVEFAGRSYLIPRDVPNLKPGRDELLRREALSLQEFLADLRERGTRLNLVILDACRDNPFEQVPSRSVGLVRGLVVAEPPEGTFIMYSAGSGESALDRLNDADADPNSVYTRSLLPLLRDPGLSLTEVAEQVRVTVRQLAAAVQHRQTPAYYNQMIGRVCIASGNCSSMPVPSPPQTGADERAWEQARESKSVPVLEAYIQQFPNTVYAALARSRVDALRAQEDGGTPASSKQSLPTGCTGVEVLVGDERRCLRPGAGRTERFRDCPTCPEMVVVPTGSFTMGDPTSNDKSPFNAGRPLRVVGIARAFAVGRFPVTVDQFGAFVRYSGHRPGEKCYLSANDWQEPSAGSFVNPGFQQTGTHPAVCVSWHDAKAYVAWLSAMTGKTYRLLSEAEREYVTRAGTATPFWWGSSISTSQANFDPTYGGATGEPRKRTVAVDSFEPNPWGLYQVHGNVYDWVEDCLNYTYQGAPVDGSAWTAGSCEQHGVRGGSWNINPFGLRSSERQWYAAGSRFFHVGFRVARTL